MKLSQRLTFGRSDRNLFTPPSSGLMPALQPHVVFIQNIGYWLHIDTAGGQKRLNYRIILNNYVSTLGVLSHLFCVHVLAYAFDPGNVFPVLSEVGIVIRHELGCKMGTTLMARVHTQRSYEVGVRAVAKWSAGGRLLWLIGLPLSHLGRFLMHS
jgi:hypothetical protein